MEIKFFAPIADCFKGVDLNITIRKNSNDTLTVSIFPFDDDVNDDAKKVIQPMLLSGTPLEIDEGFINAIKEPIQKVKGLFYNAKLFEESVKRAEEQSKREKARQDSIKKLKESSDKHLKLAEDLLAKKDYTKALSEVKFALDAYPDYDKAKSLDAEIRKQKGLGSQVSLFGEPIKAEESTNTNSVVDLIREAFQVETDLNENINEEE